jgi:hypothetical protein
VNAADPVDRRAQRRTLIVVLAAFAALIAGLIALSPAPAGIFWDDGVYVITAKALATGQGYRFIHLPGAPSATHFPPLWPALLSLVWRIFPDFPENLRWMKLLNPLLLAVGAAGGAVLGMRAARLPAWLAAIIAPACIAVAPMLLLSAVLMSEPLCLALSAPALAAATVLVVRGRMKEAVIAGVLVGLAILARSAAIVLLPSLAVGLAWHHSRRASGVALGVALVIAAPWFVWSSVHAHELGPALIGSYGPYTGWVVDGYRTDPSLLPAVIAHNAGLMFRETGIVVFSAMPRVLRPFLIVAMLLVSAVGIWFAGRRLVPVAVALAGYFALILVWPYAPGRFVWVYFSFFAILAAAAANAMVRRSRTRRAWRVPAMAAAGVTLLAVANVVRYDIVGFMRGYHRTAIEASADHLRESAELIAKLTPPNDTIATDANLTAYLYAGRIGVPAGMLTVAEYLRPKPPEQVRQEFAIIDSTFHPRWWIATGLLPERFLMRDWIIASPGRFQLISTLPNDGFAVRAIRP